MSKICKDTGCKGNITYKGCGLLLEESNYFPTNGRLSTTCKECTYKSRKINRAKGKLKKLTSSLLNELPENVDYPALTPENLKNINSSTTIIELTEELDIYKDELKLKEEDIEGYTELVEDLREKLKIKEEDIEGYKELVEELREKLKLKEELIEDQRNSLEEKDKKIVKLEKKQEKHKK